MPSANPRELAKQGDSDAIATILSQTLSQHYDATTSVIHLGNYLSVLIEASFRVEQQSTVRLVYEVISELAIDGISMVEINAQHQGDRALLWTQTLEAHFNATPPFSLISTMSNPAIDLSSLSTEIPAPPSATNALVEPTNQLVEPTNQLTEPTSQLVEPTSQLVEPTNQLVEPTNQLVEPTSQLVEPTNQLVEPTNQLVEPTNQLVEPTNQIDTSLANEDGSFVQTVLQRPEIVAMLAMALLLIFWDAYMEWMDEVDDQSVSGRQLARRLGVSSSTISRYKERTNFGEWSQTLDPDGIAWSYTGKVFVQRGEG